MMRHLGRLTDETTPRRAAEMYRAAGLDPIPIHGLVDGGCTCGREECTKSAGKHPVGARWQDREIDIDEFTDELNVGLRMGGPRNLIAIDVDGPEGREELAQLVGDLGALPNTLTSESGSGGLHYLFTTDAIDQIRNSAKKLADHVDLRVRGGQIVVAPSRHRSGGRYRWKALHDIAQLPEAWEAAILRLYEEPERPAPTPDPATRTDDYESRLRRASAYLATISPAISGSGGHTQTLIAACKVMHGFALSDADTLDLLAREYNPRCEPPWKRRELEHKVESARGFTSGALTERVPERERAYRPPERMGDWLPEPPEWWEDEPESVRPPPPDEAEASEVGEPAPAKQGPKRPAFTILSMQDLLMPVLLEMGKAGPKNRSGVPTGNQDLDDAIGRYRRGNVTILGGKKSFGKTSMTLLTVDEALDGKPPHQLLLFAGEDSAAMYGKRFMARRAGVNATLLRDMNERFTAVQLQRATDAVQRASDSLFFVPSKGVPVEHIADVITYVCKERDIELVGVDYLQCLQTRKRFSDRRLQITYIADVLTTAIKRANAAGLLLSQFKRISGGPAAWPTCEDLKESGDLENMAEHILLGHRTKDGKRLVRIGKNKDGVDDLPDIEMPFDKSTAAFTRSYGDRKSAPPENEPPEWARPREGDIDDWPEDNRAGPN